MKVGKSVSKAITEWMAEDFESAMLHACNAIDGTAKKKTYGRSGNRARFTRLIRENLDILGPMGMPGINLADTTFPIDLYGNGRHSPMDIADVIYLVHRCTHGHGDELPQGFELVPDASGPLQLTRLIVPHGKIMLSDRILFGLIAVAICALENKDEVAADGMYLTYNGGRPMEINHWWGRRDEFLDVLATIELPSVKLDFGEELYSC